MFHWEHWPFALFYFPISFAWLWYCLKSGSAWFFSASNPTLTFGGFEGEGKAEMYRHLCKDVYPHTHYVSPKTPFSDITASIKKNSFTYPLIVKPDVGMAGILVRKIENEIGLSKYHSHINVDYLIQDYIDLPIEISVFYNRYPSEKTGSITGFISKKFPCIKGDGISSIRQIMRNRPGAKIKEQDMDRILEKDEVFQLSIIGNRYHGCTFHDLSGEIDEKLIKVFDDISLSTNFYYGRYDIKCSSICELKNGRFSIIEFNGAGSIPNHIYTGKFTLLSAYKEITRHWKILYQISSYNQQEGLRYWHFFQGLKYIRNAKKHFKHLKELEKSI